MDRCRPGWVEETSIAESNSWECGTWIERFTNELRTAHNRYKYLNIIFIISMLMKRGSGRPTCSLTCSQAHASRARRARVVHAPHQRWCAQLIREALSRGILKGPSRNPTRSPEDRLPFGAHPRQANRGASHGERDIEEAVGRAARSCHGLAPAETEPGRLAVPTGPRTNVRWSPEATPAVIQPRRGTAPRQRGSTPR
jgi:hypothetical protein